MHVNLVKDLFVEWISKYQQVSFLRAYHHSIYLALIGAEKSDLRELSLFHMTIGLVFVLGCNNPQGAFVAICSANSKQVVFCNVSSIYKIQAFVVNQFVLTFLNDIKFWQSLVPAYLSILSYYSKGLILFSHDYI